MIWVLISFHSFLWYTVGPRIQSLSVKKELKILEGYKQILSPVPWHKRSWEHNEGSRQEHMWDLLLNKNKDTIIRTLSVFWNLLEAGERSLKAGCAVSLCCYFSLSPFVCLIAMIINRTIFKSNVLWFLSSGKWRLGNRKKITDLCY